MPKNYAKLKKNGFVFKFFAFCVFFNQCRYLKNPQKPEISRVVCNDCRNFFQGAEGDDAFDKAMKDPDRYVVKPQREGGGNNVYGQDIRY